MGRYVRGVLRALAAQPELVLTLLVRDLGDAAVYRELVPGAAVAAARSARTRADFHVVWYPWNGIRFTSRAPSVVTINDDFAFTYPARGTLARWREQRPIRRAAKQARHILTISDWARGALVRRFALDPQRISVIPLGPDSTFSPGVETSPYAQPFVLAVGSREERKHVGFLIGAFARAFPANDVRLVIVGELRAQPRQRAKNSGMLLSHELDIDDARLRRLYRTATVVAVPSLAEGFGLVAAEAQACGAAVVAANSTALPETVGDAAILADPRDAEAWSVALRELVGNPELNAAYRARARGRWQPGSGRRTADAVLAAFQRTIDDRV
jgi:alpha-1,3-rhamnosyl/mannosyltransferase